MNFKSFINLTLLTLLVSMVSISHAKMAHNFYLDSAKGKVSLSDFRGKVSVLYFGYTSCPDVCPTSLSRIGIAISELSLKEQQQIQAIFISLDPERDEKENLHTYLEYFLPNMIGLTGTKDEIALVAKKFNIHYRKTEVENGLDYVIDHASIYFIIGADGSLYSHLLHDAAPDEIARSIKEALADIKPTSAVISNAFIRTTPPGIKRTGAYMTLQNTLNKDIALVSVRANIAKKVEMHKHMLAEGMMTMRQVKQIKIPAGETKQLKPGGYHLMFFGLKQPIKEGEKIEVELTFSDNKQHTLQYTAKKHFD